MASRAACATQSPHLSYLPHAQAATRRSTSTRSVSGTKGPFFLSRRRACHACRARRAAAPGTHCDGSHQASRGPPFPNRRLCASHAHSKPEVRQRVRCRNLCALPAVQVSRVSHVSQPLWTGVRARCLWCSGVSSHAPRPPVHLRGESPGSRVGQGLSPGGSIGSRALPRLVSLHRRDPAFRCTAGAASGAAGASGACRHQRQKCQQRQRLSLALPADRRTGGPAEEVAPTCVRLHEVVGG